VFLKNTEETPKIPSNKLNDESEISVHILTGCRSRTQKKFGGIFVLAK
jgi:hypothetical protein